MDYRKFWNKKIRTLRPAIKLIFITIKHCLKIYKCFMIITLPL